MTARYISEEYKNWRQEVYKRDNFTCQLCGATDAPLNAHHIRPWHKYKSLRFEIWNGITLCADPCHASVSGFEVLWEYDFYKKTGGLDKLHKVFGKELNNMETEKVMNEKLLKEGEEMAMKLLEEKKKAMKTETVSGNLLEEIAEKVKKLKFSGDNTVAGNTNPDGSIDYGKEVLIPFTKISPWDIKIPPNYQRSKKTKHVKVLSRSMKRNGFFQSRVVELNENLEPIDGQQRIGAARDAGIKEIPVEISTFPSKELEAAYYCDTNSNQKSLVARELLKGQKFAGSWYAEVLYMLHEDNKSPLYRRIKGLPETTVSAQAKYAITVSQASQLINTVVLNYNMNWKKSEIQKLNNLIAEHTFEEVVVKISDFVEFFYNAFRNRDELNNMFADGPFRAMCSFWKQMCDKGLLRTPSMRSAFTKKFRKFEVPTYAVKFQQKPLKEIFLANYNSGKAKRNKVFLDK
jgi:hypothetical protein